MIVPQFWAEARLREAVDGRQITVRRFGWSDDSQMDAQASADARAEDAVARILSGEQLLRRELKRPYNGSEGVPIREEIVERQGETDAHAEQEGEQWVIWVRDEDRLREAREALAHFREMPQDPKYKNAEKSAENLLREEEARRREGQKNVIVTRNSYGALCLNTPNVLFADIDFCAQPSLRMLVASAIGLIAVAVLTGWQLRSSIVGFVALLAAILTLYPFAAAGARLRSYLAGGLERMALRRIERFVQQRPDWHLRLYRTPAGLRVLAMHQTFDPHEPAAVECFRELGTDPIYVQMCLRQRCFRARISPKPWRIGIDQHLRPRPGVWPVDPDRIPERRRWIEAYEQAARSFASCRFLEAIGSGRVDPAAREVQLLHDEHSQANRLLEIA